MTDPESMRQFLFAIDDFVPFLFTSICLISVAHFHMTTSLSLTTTIFAVSELHSAVIKNHLWHLTTLTEPDIARMIWAGTWVTLNLITAYIIFKVHVWRNIEISRSTFVAICALALFNAAHLIRYISAISLKSEYISLIYHFTIPTINIGLGVYLAFSLFRDIYDIRIQARVRRLPR